MSIAHILRHVAGLVLAPPRPAAPPLVLLDAPSGRQLGAFARAAGPDGQLHAIRICTSAEAAPLAPVTRSGNGDLDSNGNR
jgi:hypothetical protein